MICLFVSCSSGTTLTFTFRPLSVTSVVGIEHPVGGQAVLHISIDVRHQQAPYVEVEKLGCEDGGLVHSGHGSTNEVQVLSFGDEFG